MRYEISPNVVSTEVDDHVVLLNIESQEFYTIDLLAKEIWQLLEAGESKSAIVRRIVEQYDVSQRQAEVDSNAFLQQMITAGLLTPV